MSAVEIVKAIAVTAELTGTQLSAESLKVLAKDLMIDYPETLILQALLRCRRELPGHLTQAAVVDRIEQDDGRPSANEAWGSALSAFDEEKTVVLNDEITEAMSTARPIFEIGDEVGARMAFRDAYLRIVRQARLNGIRSPRWYPSLGTDPIGQTDAIQLARERGLLTQEVAATFLPRRMTADDLIREKVMLGLFEGHSNVVSMKSLDSKFKQHISKALSVLKNARRGEM